MRCPLPGPISTTGLVDTRVHGRSWATMPGIACSGDIWCSGTGAPDKHADNGNAYTHWPVVPLRGEPEGLSRWGDVAFVARAVEESRATASLQVVLIEGEAGIGKSTLLNAAIAAADSVVVVRADELADSQPSVPIDLDSLVARAEEHPLIVAVDDLHSADPCTLAMLAAMPDRLGRLPCTAILAMQPVPV